MEQAPDLVVAIAERQDREAFAALFTLFAGRVKAWMMRSGAPAEIAEEIAQETLLTVWRKAALYDPARATVSAWVFTIARNARIDRLRKDKRARQHLQYELLELDQEEPERPDGLLDTAQREARVRSALERLPAEQVRIVRLSFFDGRPHSEIAEHLGIPLGTVKSRLRLAMGRLRQILGDLT
jgi:RNA polymerase sigma-70 factor (ECF subfamily)